MRRAMYWLFLRGNDLLTCSNGIVVVVHCVIHKHMGPSRASLNRGIGHRTACHIVTADNAQLCNTSAHTEDIDERVLSFVSS